MCLPILASFVDELLAPPRLQRVLEELRASGELPEVVKLLETGDERGALDLILAAVAVAPPSDRDRLRDLAVAIFDHLGQDDPVTVAYRKRLATALY